mgnify:CR=1 FL=1
MSNQQPPTKKIKIFSSDSLVNEIPYEVWRDVICPTLGYSDRLNLNATCNELNDTFENYKQKFLKKHAIYVPQDVRTIEKAMELVAITVDPTEKDPLRIVLDKGVHEIVGPLVDPVGPVLNVPYSNIAFVGKGKDQTIIHGRFKVNNQQNVKFEELAITNSGGGSGLFLRGTNVDVLKCAVKECGSSGMSVVDGATVTATQCEFMENGSHGVYCRGANTKARLNDCQMHHNVLYGLYVWGDAVVDLHGTKTDIHSNKRRGIWASDRGAKVNIHLPSQHNTSHDNVGEDRHQVNGGSIANINADGSFTHVVVEEEDDDY